MEQQIDEIMELHNSETVTIIEAKTTFTGNFESEEDVVVAGTMIGDIHTNGDVCIFGKVTGNITCHDAIFDHAKIEGNIHCSGSLTLTSDTRLQGNVKAVEIENSGVIIGDIEVKEAACFLNNAAIEGNVKAAAFEVERGCAIKGAVMIVQNAE